MNKIVELHELAVFSYPWGALIIDWIKKIEKY